jgi:hypothetical protein
MMTTEGFILAIALTISARSEAEETNSAMTTIKGRPSFIVNPFK